MYYEKASIHMDLIDHMPYDALFSFSSPYTTATTMKEDC